MFEICGGKNGKISSLAFFKQTKEILATGTTKKSQSKLHSTIVRRSRIMGGVRRLVALIMRIGKQFVGQGYRLVTTNRSNRYTVALLGLFRSVWVCVCVCACCLQRFCHTYYPLLTESAGSVECLLGEIIGDTAPCVCCADNHGTWLYSPRRKTNHSH